MAPSKKTWIWIIVTCFALGLLTLIAVAGAGVYFLSHHVDARRSTSAEALRSIEAQRALFKDQPPLFQVDDSERTVPTRPLPSLPTSNVKPGHLWILAWDPDEGRLVKVSLPFWLLRMGRRKIDVFSGDERGFDLDRLGLDMNELERIGPALVIDIRSKGGERVLVWTQ
jgi:hypothetical protein